MILALAAVAPACSTSSNTKSAPRSGGSGGDGSAGTLNLAMGGNQNLNVGGGDGNTGGSREPTIDGTVTTSDGSTMATVTGMPKDIQFGAKLPDGTVVSNGTWTVDDTRIGSIGGDGVFHANGFVGGETTIAVHVGAGQIKTSFTVNVDITDNAASLSDADQTALKAGGPADPTFKFIYPYDGTVFPRGLSAPSLQFGDGMTVTSTANATYLKITTTHFSYQAYALGGTPLRTGIPDPVWKGVTLTANATDKVKVEVTKKTGATVSGPVTETWRIAQASLKGLIYYSTYNSVLLPPGNGVDGGGILRVRPGGKAEVVQKGCTVCHAVSANGAVMTAALGPDPVLPAKSSAYDLSPTGTATVRGAQTTEGRQYALAGLTPDGAKVLTNGVPFNAWPPQLPHGLRNGPENNVTDGYHSALVDTATGTVIASPSLSSAVKYAQSPAFSPDGKKVAFINGDKWPQRELDTLDFDGMSTFSALTKIVNNSTEMTSIFGAPQPQTLAWPSFTPDSAAIIYQQGDSFDSYQFVGGFAQSKPQYAEVRMTELDGTVKKLNALNGRDASGTTYLPYGETSEGRMNYEPTVMPLAVGGYFWVVFTSRRDYGNTIAPGRPKTTIPGDDPTQDPWGSDGAPSQRKKLWVAAIDVDHAMQPDPSHPAFYLPGQEIESANMRAFAALAPCQPDGTTCESGADCCNGFCRQTGQDASGNPILACVPPPKGCSNTDELCTTEADCCDSADLCVGGRCTEQTPPR